VTEKKLVHLVLIVWNRLEYTQVTLDSVLRCTQYPYRLHIVDNASDPPTGNYLSKWAEEHPEVVESFVRNATNEGLSVPTQMFWDHMRARREPWWGKIDNDIIFTEGWLARLVEVMEKCPSVGVASVCHYPTDFEREAQKGGIEEENGVRFYPRSHTGGCGYLLRAEACRQGGKISTDFGKMFGWSMYQAKLNKRGWKTAYAYPLVPVKHLGAWEGQDNTSPEYVEYAKTIKRFRTEGQAQGRRKMREKRKK
jgi:glycosyltransferase involved in cell wall biosynthesis